MALFSKDRWGLAAKGAPEHEQPRWKSGIFTWKLDARVAQRLATPGTVRSPPGLAFTHACQDLVVQKLY